MVEATSKFQNLLKIGMLVWGEADSETSPKRSLRRKLFKTCCMNWGEVNPTHAYYNGSCTSKDTKDLSCSTSFKTRRTQKTSSALEDFICVIFVLDRNIVQMIENKAKTLTCSVQLTSVAGRGVSPRYKVLFQVAAGQSERDTWHLACVSPRRRVSVRECSSCRALYTKNCGCSKESLEDKILVPKTPDSSQRSPQNCANCGDPVDGLYCRPCAFERKCLNEGWYTIHDENEILNTFESFNDNTNIVSAPQEPFVFNQDPGKRSSQSPPHIENNCCFECGDSLDDIFCQRCTCESSTAAIPREDGDRLLPGFMRRDIDSLFGRMVNFSRRLCHCETAHALVEKKGEAKDRFYSKLILDLGNKVRSSVEQGTAAMEKLVEKLENNERVERDIYWTRVQAHEFYQEMIHRGFVFKERPNEVIDVPIKDEKSPLSEPQGSPPDV
ncbi:hypothetical protein Tco_0005635 [Tanacetum coccineum]